MSIANQAKGGGVAHAVETQFGFGLGPDFRQFVANEIPAQRGPEIGGSPHNSAHFQFEVFDIGITQAKRQLPVTQSFPRLAPYGTQSLSQVFWKTSLINVGLEIQQRFGENNATVDL